MAKQDDAPIRSIAEPDDRTLWAEGTDSGKLKLAFRLRSGRVIRLTVKQRLFVSEYMKDLNATEASIRAGYSERSVRQGGRAQPIYNESVRAAIQEEFDYRAAAADMSTDRILAGYVNIARGDIGRIIQWDDAGNISFTPSGQINPEDSAAIQEITRDKNGSFRIRMHDPVRALDSLAKHHGMFREHNKREVTFSLEHLVLSSYQESPSAALPKPSDSALQLGTKLVQQQIVDAVLADDGGDDE
jgi:phage terminase small subunit